MYLHSAPLNIHQNDLESSAYIISGLLKPAAPNTSHSSYKQVPKTHELQLFFFFFALKNFSAPIFFVTFLISETKLLLEIAYGSNGFILILYWSTSLHHNGVGTAVGVGSDQSLVTEFYGLAYSHIEELQCLGEWSSCFTTLKGQA